MVAVYVIIGFIVLLVLFFASGKNVDPAPVATNDEEVKNIALSGRKMIAVKEYQKLHGTGHEDSLHAVNEMLKNSPVDPQTEQKIKEVKRLLNRGEKIAAIKAYREIYGIGLKDAKEAVELIADS